MFRIGAWFVKKSSHWMVKEIHTSKKLKMTGKTALVGIAAGSEELEAVAVIDILRRAGTEVTVACCGAKDKTVVCSRQTVIVADVLIEEVKDKEFDLIVAPGGMPGATHLHECKDFTTMIKNQAAKGGLIGAICAAPAVVLEPLGILKGKTATCHPAFYDKLENGVEDRVVVADDKIVTSRGPGTAIEFSLKLVELLWGEEKAKHVAKPMITHL